ncbi:MAG: hypothetical protein M1142_05105 [Patescibacteria group bacterium]|nr:hypothetical protein [Patescibacteria group bacterium]
MSYSRSKKQTENEKKLQVLKAQLYGKDIQVSLAKPSSNFAFKAEPGQTTVLETDYLRKDLLKITILAILAIGGQLLLFIFDGKLL